jgi:hypothetical protein
MKRLVGVLMAAFLLMALNVTGAHAQTANGTVTGKTVRWDGSAIAGATVRALTGPLETDTEVSRTTTGGDGSYTLSVPVGQAYWIHVDTLGTWWGYSYKPALTLRPGEVISQVYFAQGPRDVKEIVLPTPVSNLEPAVDQPAVKIDPVAVPPATAPVIEFPVSKPISNVAPLVGSAGSKPTVAHTSKPVSNVKPLLGSQAAPHSLPATGAPVESWAVALAAALAALGLGVGLRRSASQSR